MSDTKTHWRTIAGKKNLVGELLQDKECTMTIKETKSEDVINIKKTKQNKGEPVYDKKGVVYFIGTDMKLVLNIVNFKTITAELGSPYIEDWVGKKITLVPLKGKWFGENQTAIRIKADIKKYV